MLSDEEFKERLKKAQAAGARHGKVAGEAMKKTRVKAGSAAKRAAAATANTAAKGAKKTQELVVKTVHHVMGSEEYKRKATEVNERLAAVVQSLEDSITRRDIEIERLRKRVADLEGGTGRG